MTEERMKIMNIELVSAIAKEERACPMELFFPNIMTKLEAIKARPALAEQYGVSASEIYQ